MSFFVETPSIDQLSARTESGPIFSYHFGDRLRTPYLHPLRTPGGVSLTEGEPDASGLRGLSVSGLSVNGVRFSEGSAASGRIVTPPDSAETEIGEDSATIRVHHSWRSPDGEPLLEETRSFIAYAPDEDGWQTLDWISELEAIRETEILNERFASGLCLAGSKALPEGDFLNSRGREGSDADRSGAEWCAWFTSDPSSGMACGFAMLVGRSNPNPRPAFYSQSTPSPRLCSAWAERTPFHLRKGERSTLRYRLLFFDGAMDEISLQMRYTAFMWG
jgi:hypothetical protein